MPITIFEEFGSGGANIVPGGAGGVPSLASALRQVADDLDALKTRTDSAMQTKLDAVIDQQLVLRTKLDSHVVNFNNHRGAAGVHIEADSVNGIAAPVTTTIETDILLLVNDAYDMMLLHMAMPDTGAGVHPGGPDTNNVMNPALYPATTEGEAVALHNEIHTQYTAHIANTGGAWHTVADTTNTYTEGAASDWDDLVATANGLKDVTGFNQHVVLEAGPTHGASDVANSITAPDCGVQIAALWVELNEIKDDYSLHCVSMGLHPNPGTVEGTADATTEATAVALVNALKATLTTHLADAAVHLDADVLAVIAADATEYEDIIPLTVEAREDYVAHIGKSATHAKADAGNVETVVGAGGDVAVLGTGAAVTIGLLKG